MSKHKKRKHKRVADPHDDYMQKRHAYWAACAKKGELTEEQAHTCDELEMFVSAVIVFSDISPKDIEMFERAWSFRDVFLRFACQPEDDLEPSFYFHEEERYRHIQIQPHTYHSSTPFYPPVFFTMVVCGFLIILIVNFTNGFGKQFRGHTNTSLSIKYCFIFWRISVSRTDTFFSDIPTRFAMSA